MGTMWFVTAPAAPGWRLDPTVVEAALKELLPTVVVGREGAGSSDLVWRESRNKQWVEGRLDLDAPDSVVLKGWPELIVDHALVLSRLIPDSSEVVLANDQGDVYDLHMLSDREALLAAIEGDADV